MVENNINLEGKTILVTGAAGFIGSNLVKRLFHDIQDIKVIGIDSITDYYDVNIKYERLKEIEALNRDWTFVHASIADKDAVEIEFRQEFHGRLRVGVTAERMRVRRRRKVHSPDGSFRFKNSCIKDIFPQYVRELYGRQRRCPEGHD